MDNDGDDAFRHGFHNLPNEKVREAMSVLKLAELLEARKSDAVANTVLSHELNLKIAKIQSKATLDASWLGAGATIAASILTFILGYFFGASQLTKSTTQSQAESPTVLVFKESAVASKPSVSATKVLSAPNASHTNVPVQYPANQNGISRPGQ